MVFCSFRHFGRMGNFLWECACAYGFAKKHNLIFSVNPITNDTKWNPVYLEHLVHPNFQLQEDILINEHWTTTQHFNDYQYTDEMVGKNIIFNGYNQSYKYWDFCREEMLNDFRFPYNKREKYISVHIRRGDYLKYRKLHPVVTHEYLDKAIVRMMESGFEDYTFLFHSDDIEWAKEYASKWGNLKVEFSEGKDEIGDLISMANCEHQICSNSTLATWGAELNRNPDKIVIVPSEQNWFGIDNSIKMTIKDMYRPEWIQITYTPVYELPLEEQLKYKLQ